MIHLRAASYDDFLNGKVRCAARAGFDVAAADINPGLKPHAALAARWALAGGRRAIFASFGLHKTSIQLELMRQIGLREQAPTLIVLPLDVRHEFISEHKERGFADLGMKLKFIRSTSEMESGNFTHLTNYESVREGKIDTSRFVAASLDEAAILRGFGGTKTFREFMRLFDAVRYRFVNTATPSPNEYIELLAYAAFLDIMDVGQAKTRFFRRNSEKADELTIHPHKEREFWLWVASWALFIRKPSDLGFSDEGYELPALDVRWHEIPSDHSDAGEERDGQYRLMREPAIGIVAAAREKRDSLDARIDKMMELRADDVSAHRIVWHDLEAERHAIEKAIPSAVTVYGAQDPEQRAEAIRAFSRGSVAELGGKPVMLGSGSNFQRYCAWAIFLGIGHKFKDFIQAIHRLQRFGQTGRVRIDLIYTEGERAVRASLEEKWRGHEMLMEKMSAIIREFGLAEAAIAGALKRSIGCERIETRGENFVAVRNDCVVETAAMEADSVHLILTSIPFSTQYEYTPSYNDFGHSESNEEFWAQMDFLSPQLFRVLKPGRVFAVHVKDRIVPGGMTGLGFQTVYAMHADALRHYQRHGFAYLGMKTIATDVVRENNQTYRLGWTEQCKDGTRMGVGMPEYLLMFRKPPSDCSNGYADEPVAKDKPLCDDSGVALPFDAKSNWKKPVPGTGYSRARWQLDAHGFARSSGDRLISREELMSLKHAPLYQRWRDRSVSTVYDYEAHVALCEEMDHAERLPSTFMQFPPHSPHPDIWSDVARMRTLNGLQAAKGREMHLCPLQFDIVDRAIVQFTAPGETVYDPFMGLGTVPVRAVRLKRVGRGCELSNEPGYYPDAVGYLKGEERRHATPTLFGLLEAEDALDDMPPVKFAAGLRFVTRSGAIVKLVERLDTGHQKRDLQISAPLGAAYLLLCRVERNADGSAPSEPQEFAVHEDGSYLASGEHAFDLIREVAAAADELESAA
jgi:hypothetical protein